jgi:hypothetical protein
MLQVLLRGSFTLLFCTLLLTTLSFTSILTADAFVITNPSTLLVVPSTISPRCFPLQAAKGGGFASKQTSKSVADTTSVVALKPKQQWDRYLTMPKTHKDAATVRVAVRKQQQDEWLEVGAVRLQPGVDAAAAVARQRSLIADVRVVPCMLSYAVRVCGRPIRRI